MSSLYLYTGKRLGYSAVTLLFISMIVFYITQVLPGNAAVAMLGQTGTPERVALLEESLGLNEPIHVQYMNWVGSALQGDFGRSIIHDQPVLDLLLPSLIRSSQLVVLSLISVTIIGITLGVVAAFYKNTKVDSALRLGSYIGVSLPEFVVAIMLILLFAGPFFQVFSSGGYASPSEGIITWAKHVILPTAALTMILTAHVLRLTRSDMIEVLESDYVRTARLKGLSEQTVLFKHALRNGLLPTITTLAMNVGFVLGGIVVVEVVFSYPGVGRLLVRAIENRDIPLIQASVLVIAASYVVTNFLADVIYTKLDPRIDYGDGA